VGSSPDGGLGRTERVRTFLAITLEDEMRKSVARWMASLGGGLGAGRARHVRWVDPPRLHLTLHFFGALTLAERAAVSAALEPTWPEPAFSLQLDGAGVFPPRGSPRVVWVGVTPRQPIARVHAEVERRLTPLGLADPDSGVRPFKPHLTVGRLRRETPGSVGRDLQALLVHARIEAPSSWVDRLTLFESHLLPRGPAYHPFAEYRLLPREGTALDERESP